MIMATFSNGFLSFEQEPVFTNFGCGVQPARREIVAEEKPVIDTEEPRGSGIKVKLARVATVAAAAAGLLAAAGLVKGSVNQDDVLKAQRQLSSVSMMMSNGAAPPLLLVAGDSTQASLAGHVSHASHASHKSHASHRSSL